MNRIVMICGLIAGAIVSTFMVSSVAFCYNSGSFDGNIFVGYASMVLAFSLIFVGVKNFRDKQNQGFISFWKAFKLGLFIALVASTVYVFVWLIDYYFFIPDFMQRYTDSVIANAKAEGATAADIEKQLEEMSTYKEMYKNPFFVILLTYAEIMPVGIVVALISALILKRSERKPELA